MKTNDIQVLYDKPMLVGENPLWHAQEDALYWIDIAGKAIHRHHISTDTHSEWSLPSEPGCIALNQEGGLVVAMRAGIAFFDTKTGELKPLLDAPYDTSKLRFNDGRCDAEGRLWVGTLYEPRDRPGASLYCLDREQLRDVDMPVTTSNGVAFSKDFRSLFHTDTRAHQIRKYKYDLSNGKISDEEVFHQFSLDTGQGYGGRPDGAAIDSEGAYWCAMFEGQRILRLSPTGDILKEIPLPVRCPTMVAFGGSDLKTIFITSARQNRPDDEISSLPFSGFVLHMQVDVAGQLEFAYKPQQ